LHDRALRTLWLEPELIETDVRQLDAIATCVCAGRRERRQHEDAYNSSHPLSSFVSAATIAPPFALGQSRNGLWPHSARRFRRRKEERTARLSANGAQSASNFVVVVTRSEREARDQREPPVVHEP